MELFLDWFNISLPQLKNKRKKKQKEIVLCLVRCWPLTFGPLTLSVSKRFRKWLLAAPPNSAAPSVWDTDPLRPVTGRKVSNPKPYLAFYFERRVLSSLCFCVLQNQYQSVPVLPWWNAPWETCGPSNLTRLKSLKQTTTPDLTTPSRLILTEVRKEEKCNLSFYLCRWEPGFIYGIHS